MKKLIPLALIFALPFFLNATPIIPIDHLNSKPGYVQGLTPPEYPGGQSALEHHVLGKIKWPERNESQVLEVIVSFFVEKDGSLSGFKVEKSLSPSFDKQVLQILMHSPRWIPAMHNDKPIKSKYTLPIRYHITFSRVDSLKH